MSSRQLEEVSYSIPTDRILNKEKFDVDVIKTVACVICNKIPIKPVQKPSHEGVFYCSPCLQEFFKERNLPVTITDSITYKFLFGKLEIICKNKPAGCIQSFMYKKILDLFDHESKCEKNCMKCPSYDYCKVSGLQKDINEHVKICEFVKILCEKCGHYFVKKEFNNHNCINSLLNQVNDMTKKYEGQIQLLDEQIRNMSIKIEKLENENYSIKSEISIISTYLNDFSGSEYLKIVLFHPFFKEILRGKNAVLSYKATEYDFSTELFHKNVDGKGASIAIIRCHKNLIVGGYTPVGWNINENEETTYNPDNSLKGFIFSITHNLKFNLIYPEKALCSNMRYGPCFGKGDIVVHENLEESKFNPGISYQNDEKNLFNDKKGLIKIKDYEIFIIA